MTGFDLLDDRIATARRAPYVAVLHHAGEVLGKPPSTTGGGSNETHNPWWLEPLECLTGIAGGRF